MIERIIVGNSRSEKGKEHYHPEDCWVISVWKRSKKL